MYAPVAKLVDALDLESSGCEIVPVRVRRGAPYLHRSTG